MNVPLTSLEPRVNAGALPLEALSRNEHVSDRDKTKEVARQFEAVLLRQILQSAHKTGLEGIGGDDEDSASKEIYFDMMNYHLADTISRGGGLGLTSALEAQLTRQTSPSATEEAPAA